MLRNRQPVEAVCDRCLLPSEVGARIEDLIAAGWELREDAQTWCLDCSRKAREVPFPANSRGMRRRRR